MSRLSLAGWSTHFAVCELIFLFSVHGTDAADAAVQVSAHGYQWSKYEVIRGGKTWWEMCDSAVRDPEP